MQLFSQAAAAASVVVFLGAAAGAAPIFVPNGGFEAEGGQYSPPAEWQEDLERISPGFASSGTVASSRELVPSMGTQMSQVSLSGDDDPDTSLIGTISTTSDLGTYAPNTTYTLTFEAARDNYVVAGNWFVLGGLRGDGVDITGIDQDILDLTDGETTGEVNVFYPVTVSFSTADNPDVVGEAISIYLGFRHEDNHSKSLFFDNVQLDATPIPEPAAMALLAGGALFALRRRKA